MLMAFSPVSSMLDLSDSPNSEFINNYNLRCTVDLLANEVVTTEIDQEESDSEGEDLPGDILPCDDHPLCAYYTGHSSIYETVETQLYVCIKCTTIKGCITWYFNYASHVIQKVIIKDAWNIWLPDNGVPGFG